MYSQNLMHVKNMCFTVPVVIIIAYVLLK